MTGKEKNMSIIDALWHEGSNGKDKAADMQAELLQAIFPRLLKEYGVFGYLAGLDESQLAALCEMGQENGILPETLAEEAAS